MTNEERVSEIVSKLEAPAFPSVLPIDTLAVSQGITKREYFALHMFQGSALMAVRAADELLAELARTKPVISDSQPAQHKNGGTDAQCPKCEGQNGFHKGFCDLRGKA